MDFGYNIKKERKKQGLTLEELASRSGVSKSMLSMIERGEKNPSIQVASQIAEGLEVTISYLLGEQQKKEVYVIRSEKRLIYKDESTGVERHLLSPSFPSKGIEFILNIIPPMQETGVFPTHESGVKEYIYVAQGKLQIELGSQPEKYLLEKGDSIYFEADLSHRFINLSKEECHYYLVIDSNRISK